MLVNMRFHSPMAFFPHLWDRSNCRRSSGGVLGRRHDVDGAAFSASRVGVGVPWSFCRKPERRHATHVRIASRDDRRGPLHRQGTDVPLSQKKARPAGFEPATTGLEGRCSIQLSYGRTVGTEDYLTGRLVSSVGRGSRIRTCDPLLPKQMRYQTAPRPDNAMIPYRPF